MCGIAGMYTYKNSGLQQEYFSRCTASMRKRGPDAEGVWHNERNYITVFTRLAIRDLSANGNQPMQSDCGNYVISFNGEVYNTAELENALKPFGQQYQSSSDTELLLYALKWLGIDATLAITDGIFAFAFFDTRQNRLLLARDRVGVKPLYVGESSEGVVFSSQYDHVINHVFFRDKSLDEHVVASYLDLGYVADGMGIVRQTKHLPHGHYMIIANGKTETKRYYRYGDRHAQAAGQGDSLENIIRASVNSQLVSDVPVGSFMSGGVDSTLISYYANQQRGIDAFTIGIKDHELNETEAAKQYAVKFKLQHYCRYISPNDLVQLIDDHTAAYSEPFADYSSLPTLLLSAFAKEQVTVALSGDGPDELFWGYARSVKLPSLLSFYTKGSGAKRVKLLLSKFRHFQSIHLGRHWNSGNFPSYYYSSLFITGALANQKSLLNFEPQVPEFYNDALEAFEASGGDGNVLMQIARQLEMDIHLQRILLKVDRASMYHSLEVRVPYLSNAMLDYSSCLSWQDCIVKKEGKVNMKRLLAAKFGAEQVFKEKRGFRIPLAEWMRNELKQEVTEKLMEMPASLLPLFNRKKLGKIITAHMQSKQDHSWLLWAVYALVRWDREHWSGKR